MAGPRHGPRARVCSDWPAGRVDESRHSPAERDGLATPGGTIGAIVHDINNLLTALQIYNASVLDRAEVDSHLRPDLVEMGAILDRAGTLTRQLLTYSRQRANALGRLDLNDGINGVLAMLRRLLGLSIDIVTELDPSLRPVHSDRSQLERVIVNIAMNARDAMPEGGSLLIQTRQLETPNGCFGRLVMRDSGVGMDDETRRSIFDPFFTTKPPTEGTGLGLSTAQAIVSAAGGRIHVTSVPGHGTTFTIDLLSEPFGRSARPPASTS